MIKKNIIKVVVFLVVAITTAFLVNKLNNVNLESVSREMEEAVLPIAYCEFENQMINKMQGYTQVMSTTLMRESVVPLNDDYGVNILLDDDYSYGQKFSYELRTVSGDSLVENGEPEQLPEKNGYKSFSVKFRMDMKKNQEYMLVFIAENAEGEKARYYTRVVNLDEQHLSAIIRSANEFRNATFEKDINKEDNLVYKYINPKGTEADNDMSHVNLNASYNMVCWGDMYPIIVSGIIPQITEVDSNFAVVKYEYIAETVNDEISHFYNIEEYVSGRYENFSEEVKVLSYDRYQDSFFDASYIKKDINAISLGIADNKDVEFVSSEDNTKLGFVKRGQLWLYDYVSDDIVRVFSYNSGDYTDQRTMNSNIDINIADLDDEGNIRFVVYGYMPRGAHEGQNGLSLYTYTAEDNRIKEEFFVQCDEAYSVMKQEVGKFTYYSEERNEFYFLLDGVIYKIDMNNMSKEIVAEGLTSDKYYVSENRKIVAYPDNVNDSEVKKIYLHNFETEEVFCEEGKESDRFLALGFVNNDLIFGKANANDIIITANREAILPLYELLIEKPDGEMVKNYSKKGLYIMNARVDEDKIYLKRATKENNFFAEAEPDFISYKKDLTKNNVSLMVNFDNIEYNQVDMIFPSNIYISDNVTYIITKSKDEQNYKEFDIKTSTNEDNYYVFYDTGYDSEYNSAGRAISSIEDGKIGLVVDNKGNTIYRSVDTTEYNTIADEIRHFPCKNIKSTLKACAYMCIEYIDSRVQYEDIKGCSSWQEAFEKNTSGVGIDISGIDLSTALYFLDRDVPIAARIDDGRYVLIISYNSTHIRYYDPMLDEEVKVTRSEFESSLSKRSNEMYTYTSQ